MDDYYKDPQVPEYNQFMDQYEFTHDGMVISKATGLPKSQRGESKGYLRVNLWSRQYQKYFTIRVHRLIAWAFLPNPDGFRLVNHKDGDRTNNHITNLEWADDQENACHREAMRRGELEEYYHGRAEACYPVGG